MKYVIALFLLLAFAHVSADSWISAKTMGVASSSGQIVVRIVPGENMNAVFGFSGSKKGNNASAVFYRLDSSENYSKYQEISLLNPIAPVFAAVADTGEFVTLDNWHNMGLGTAVVAVYSSDGKVLRSHSLTDMYTEAEIRKFERSVSSVWWRCSAPPIFEPRTHSLELMDALGSNVKVNLKTGEVQRDPASQKGC